MEPRPSGSVTRQLGSGLALSLHVYCTGSAVGTPRPPEEDPLSSIRTPLLAISCHSFSLGGPLVLPQDHPKEDAHSDRVPYKDPDLRSPCSWILEKSSERAKSQVGGAQCHLATPKSLRSLHSSWVSGCQERGSVARWVPTKTAVCHLPLRGLGH